MSTPTYQLPARSYGSRYEETKDLTNKQIAARMRRDIRAAVKAGTIPNEKYSVRMDGRSIDIRINSWTAPVWDDTDDWEPDSFLRRKHAPKLARTLAWLDDLHRSYNYDGSDIMVDYFDVRFYGTAQLAWGIEEGKVTEVPTNANKGPAASAADAARAELATRWPAVSFKVRGIPRRGYNSAQVVTEWTDGPTEDAVRSALEALPAVASVAWVGCTRYMSDPVAAAYTLSSWLESSEWFVGMDYNADSLGPWLDCGAVVAGITDGGSYRATIEATGVDALASLSGTTAGDLLAWTLRDAFSLADFPAA